MLKIDPIRSINRLTQRLGRSKQVRGTLMMPHKGEEMAVGSTSRPKVQLSPNGIDLAFETDPRI